jgi:hypothetical protein
MTKKWNGFTLSCTMNHYNMLGLSIKKPDAAVKKAFKLSAHQSRELPNVILSVL